MVINDEAIDVFTTDTFCTNYKEKNNYTLSTTFVDVAISECLYNTKIV